MGSIRSHPSLQPHDVDPRGIVNRSGTDTELNVLKPYRHAEDLPRAKQTKQNLADKPPKYLSPPEDGGNRRQQNMTGGVDLRNNPLPFTKSKDVRTDSPQGGGPSLASDRGSLSQRPPQGNDGMAFNPSHSRVNSPSQFDDDRLESVQDQRPAERRNTLDKQLQRMSTQSTSELAQLQNTGHRAEGSETSNTDYRSVLRRCDPQSSEQLRRVVSPQPDYRSGLRHINPKSREALAPAKESSPTVMRRAPSFVKDHSRHRSPSGLSSCGYCEPEGVTDVVVSGVPPSGQESRRESYQTAYSPGDWKQLRRVRDGKTNLRDSATSSTRDCKPTSVREPAPRSSPLVSSSPTPKPSATSSDRTATPSAASVPPLKAAGTSPQLGVHKPLPIRHSDHHCE